jgi:hypothetical protein
VYILRDKFDPHFEEKIEKKIEQKLVLFFVDDFPRDQNMSSLIFKYAQRTKQI